MEAPKLDKEVLKSLLARANAFKEGDMVIGGTEDEQVRELARKELGTLKLGDVASVRLIEDGVSAAIERSLNPELAKAVASLTFADLKAILLGPECASWVEHYRDGLKSELIAAVVKLMTNEELSRVCKAIHNPLKGSAPGEALVIGDPGHFGSRIQPNSPGDDPEEILLSVLEGLAYGCGDVIIGLNPASDSVESIVRSEKLLKSIVDRLKLPTRYCVLSDMVKQRKAQESCPVDVGFQSLAGTSKALIGMLGLDADGYCDLCKSFDGLYFETGQGSAVTNRAAEGVDMVTLEARCYGLARYIRQQNGDKWMIVNDVSGFIGPEVYRTGEQLFRACLEDTAMAKLHGITIGLDVCSTFHMGIGPMELQKLTEKIVETAAPAYLMGVAGKADPMLGYMTTSFREHPRLRAQSHKQIASVFSKRLVSLGAVAPDGQTTGQAAVVSHLYAQYMAAGGDKRSQTVLKEEGKAKIAKLRARGFDLGYGCAADMSNLPETDTRMQNLFDNARTALFSTIDPAVLGHCCPSHFPIETLARNRAAYLSHPELGEQICERDIETLRKMFEGKTPQIVFVVSDGLNANAINDSLLDLLPILKHKLQEAKYVVADADVVIKEGRVRAGYHVGACIGVESIVHIIGERPGTGLNQLSAYITYGKDFAGEPRWTPTMDHSLTTAICGIHPQGLPIDRAIEEIFTCVKSMLEQKASGVVLSLTKKSAGTKHSHKPRSKNP